MEGQAMPIVHNASGTTAFPAAPVTAVAVTAFTAVDAGAIDATFGAPELAVLENVRTRVNECVAAIALLQAAVNTIITALETADVVQPN